ncbi:T9SS type A sorting domain-containing protein [Gramella sp. AN32]|uniref:T9SS type A sorting domain-containing protein n=1 Tax=Christiangramia antarctica TaxID=2058158 RepID=A0ABW5XB46_9FLAO|nr:T9SS type A sorting domain-containing protein [Gramella sp. AN32]
MKKTMKTMVLVLVALFAMSATASDDLDLKVNNRQNLVVNVQQIEKGAVLILKDEKGLILFKDKFFEEHTYSKTLDFNDLPNGEYVLSLDKKFSVLSTTITKRGEEITVETPEMNILFKPSFKKVGKKIYFFLANPDSKNAVLEIYDNSGQLVGTAKSDNVVIKKMLDFSQMPKGDYSATVKLDNKVFTEKISI